ncbi:bifunctional diguanylate cyclase/phosphodiesterase [Dactylosporangium aurantiacum]|uniref:Bifunctional diguanylate cyclase/phosphodiesterase n=2 Tax=Dactylosporangium aurantiacum TaxID=35754 RepID=A0A9Q9IQD1_9ACTN|nr:bifunctional diguanylate cyclase/phosphodiesterase [Dactylosporangium aurantiacum]
MSKLMRTSCLVLVACVAWFAVNLVTPVGPPVLLWVPIPVGALLLTAAFHRTARTASLPAPTRRFWGHLSVSAFLVGVAHTTQAIDVLAHPGVGGAYNGPGLLIFDSGAILLILYALYRLPLTARSAGERLRVALDGGTVVAGAAVFIWHFQTRDALGSDNRGQVVGSLILGVLALVVVLAVAKVMLSGYEFIDKSALQWLAFAIFFGATSSLLQPLLGPDRPHLMVTQVGIPVVCCLASWAAERQRRATRRVVTVRRRPFSLVPYAAVVAVYVLLILETWNAGHGDQKMMVVGAVTLTALVMVRQVAAFVDNGRLLARLDHGATHDALTQLPNRSLFGQRLQQALAAEGAGRAGRPVSVALIDLDDFKEVNDTLGHEVGDLLLVDVARRLAGCAGPEDTVARLGGDEFVVVLPGADPAAAGRAAGRMADALRAPAVVNGHELPVSASIGIADGRTGDDPSVLLRHADIAMYAAKQQRGTTFLHFDETMSAPGGDHAQLRAAITDGRCFLVYQPIVSLDDGRLAGAEALVRWDHPEHGVLPPDTFIPLAERTGLIVPLGRFVLTEAVRQFAAWHAQYGAAAPTVLNINVSPRELREADYADFVAGTLATHGVDASRVVLEITESLALDLGPAVATLDRLRALGLRISLDDFGTGSSTLRLLHDCPVDEVKLDRSFTQAPASDRAPVAAAVIQLARALRLHAVAEGVETPEQAEQLRSLGYRTAQGYHFARPVPAAQLTEWMTGPPVPAQPSGLAR